jgi:hypothetical protein
MALHALTLEALRHLSTEGQHMPVWFAWATRHWLVACHMVPRGGHWWRAGWWYWPRTPQG